jgi:hypothetical protein
VKASLKCGGGYPKIIFAHVARALVPIMVSGRYLHICFNYLLTVNGNNYDIVEHELECIALVSSPIVPIC